MGLLNLWSTKEQSQAQEATIGPVEPQIDRAAPTRPTWYSPSVLLPTTVLTSGLLLANFLYRRNLRRISSVLQIPPAFLNNKRTLFGRVTSVGDADNFRFFHTPGGRLSGWDIWRSVPTERKDISKSGTLHIRLAGVDAPEAAHFGNPAQPYAKEALEWLTSYVGGRRVRVQLWSRDRYERVVCSVKIWKWNGRRDVSLEMVKAGWATVYLQAGAQYGGIEHELKTAEVIAK